MAASDLADSDSTTGRGNVGDCDVESKAVCTCVYTWFFTLCLQIGVLLVYVPQSVVRLTIRTGLTMWSSVVCKHDDSLHH